MGIEDTEEFEAISRGEARSGPRFLKVRGGNGGGERLARGTLSSLDIASSTMANIAPAMSFYFSFSFIAATSGLASPLVIVLAAVAVAILGNTLTEFSKSTPSAGSFATFIGKALGPVAGTAASMTVSIGYVIVMSGAVVMSGGWLEIIIRKYLHAGVPWEIFATAFVLGAAYLLYRGVRLSTKVAATLLGIELGILVIVSVAVLLAHHRAMTLQPFNPLKLSGGLSGLSLGFPLAVFMFVGWENSAALAEETAEPRRSVPKAVYTSIAVMGAVYVFLGYVTTVGFGNDVGALAGSPVPFLEAAKGISGLLLFLAYLGGLTSVLGSLVAGANSQSRIVFSSGREGMMPSFTGKVSASHRTPWASIVLFLGIALFITFAFGGQTDPVVFFSEIATLGTIPIALVYLVSNLALPFYYRRHHPEEYRPLQHLVLPLLGVLCIGVPIYELIKPGQAAPFAYYPFIALAMVAAALVYALYLNRKDPGLEEKIGSFVADSD